MKILLLLSLLAIVGCVPSQLPMRVYEARPTKVRSYTIGLTQAASIGDPIVTVQNGSVTPSYRVLFDYQPPDAGYFNSQPAMTKGDEWAVRYSVDADSMLILGRSENRYGLSVYPSGAVALGWIGLTDARGMRMVQSDWTSNKLLENSDEKPSAGTFKAELIYSGLTGSTLKCIYREYVNDYARPAFTTDLQYNLDESKTIAYKSIRIDVLSATNQKLEFVVADDGGLPWVP